MRCKACGSETIRVGHFDVCPNHGDVTPAVTAVTDDELASLRERVITRYPFPIAFGYKRYVDAGDNTVMGLKNLFYTYSATVRLLTVILLADYLHGPTVLVEVNREIRKLSRPSLGTWVRLLRLLAKPGTLRDPFAPDLLDAVRVSLARTSESGLGVYDQIVSDRNNVDGHGATWDTDDSAYHRDRVAEAVHRVLGDLTPLSELSLILCRGNTYTRHLGAIERPPEIPVRSDRLRVAFHESRALLQRGDGELLRLAPLIVAQEEWGNYSLTSADHNEPLLVFDGHDEHARLDYIGVRDRYRSQVRVTPYAELLGKSHIDLRRLSDEIRLSEMTEAARAATQRVIARHTGKKYFPATYCRREAGVDALDPGAVVQGVSLSPGMGRLGHPGVEPPIERWLATGNNPVLVVVGSAGTGKTSLFCHLADSLLAASPDPGDGDDCVLMLLGEDLSTTDVSLFERILDGLGVASHVFKTMEELLRAWRRRASDEPRRLIILVDAVNEARDPQALISELADLAAQLDQARQGGTDAKLLVSLRDSHRAAWASIESAPHFERFADTKGKPQPWLPLRAFRDDEAERTWAAHQRGGPPQSAVPWASLTDATRRLLKRPLMMRLYHEAYRDRGADTPTSVELGALWTAWWAHKPPAVQAHALALARQSVVRGEATLTESVIDNWYAAQVGQPISWGDTARQLEDENLIHRLDDGSWDWLLDALAEWLFAEVLRHEDPHLGVPSLRRWLAYPETARLNQALKRIGADVWRQGRSRDLSVWLAEPPDVEEDASTEEGQGGETTSDRAANDERIVSLLAGSVSRNLPYVELSPELATFEPNQKGYSAPLWRFKGLAEALLRAAASGDAPGGSAGYRSAVDALLRVVELWAPPGGFSEAPSQTTTPALKVLLVALRPVLATEHAAEFALRSTFAEALVAMAKAFVVRRSYPETYVPLLVEAFGRLREVVLERPADADERWEFVRVASALAETGEACLTWVDWTLEVRRVLEEEATRSDPDDPFVAGFAALTLGRIWAYSGDMGVALRWAREVEVLADADSHETADPAVDWWLRMGAAQVRVLVAKGRGLDDTAAVSLRHTLAQLRGEVPLSQDSSKLIDRLVALEKASGEMDILRLTSARRDVVLEELDKSIERLLTMRVEAEGPVADSLVWSSLELLVGVGDRLSELDDPRSGAYFEDAGRLVSRFRSDAQRAEAEAHVLWSRARSALRTSPASARRVLEEALQLWEGLCVLLVNESAKSIHFSNRAHALWVLRSVADTPEERQQLLHREVELLAEWLACCPDDGKAEGALDELLQAELSGAMEQGGIKDLLELALPAVSLVAEHQEDEPSWWLARLIWNVAAEVLEHNDAGARRLRAHALSILDASPTATERGHVLFWHACDAALLGDAERALALLAGAVDAGYSDLDQIREDQDLDHLRSHPDFAVLLGRMAETNARESVPEDSSPEGDP